jgi:hypothetical protein
MSVWSRLLLLLCALITAAPSLATAQDAGAPDPAPADPPTDPAIAGEDAPPVTDAPPAADHSSDRERSDAIAPGEAPPPDVDAPSAEIEAAPPAATPSPVAPEISATATEPAAPPPADDGIRLTYGGEYQVRFNMMSDIPLRALPRTDPAQSSELGQNYWGEQWLRLRGELRFSRELRIIGQMDLLRGVAFGDLAIGVAPEALRRDQYGYPGVRLRFLYLEWLTSIGMLRVGQMGFSWGLGMVANDGDTPPPFGDYRYGDLVRRILFATRPLGLDTPWVVALSADWVGWDLLADFERREELAFQGVLASYYGDEQDRIGAYGAYRWQQNQLGDQLAAGFVDIYGRYGFEDGIGGRIYGAIELAYARGTTTYARTVEQPEQLVEMTMGIVQIGRTSPELDVVLEAGYASGDSNTEDAIQSRATIDPDHRVGLVLFPEVMAAQSARSAHLAQDPALAGRASRGSELLPTNGGVSGAAYLFPYAIYRPFEWLDLRLGGVLAFATSDVADPFAQRALSRTENARGGSAGARDLGVEVDAAVLFRIPLVDDLILQTGLEGGVLVPGGAFDDALGQRMGPVGLARIRLGLRYR